MVAAILRMVRILLAQGIVWGLAAGGGNNIPVINITIGGFVNALFKYLRDKFPKNKFLEWLPI